jgi:hypothetical protein
VQGRKEGFFFFEKKKQKAFVSLGFGLPGCSEPILQKFLGSFFQKRTAFHRPPGQ